MIKYSNLLSFNIIVHNKYHRGNQGYRGAFSKRPLKGKIQWTTTKSKSLTAWGPVSFSGIIILDKFPYTE